MPDEVVTRECSAPQAALLKPHEGKLIDLTTACVRIQAVHAEGSTAQQGDFEYKVTIQHVRPQTAGLYAPAVCEDAIVALFWPAIANFVPYY